MPINKETIISVFDEKLTLMQWLKTINKALDEAVLTGVEVRQKGNATFSFVVTFEDGTELESNEFILAQGESINGATIRNGHLYLSLTNGTELDAGNVKPVSSFSFNAQRHLIVNYDDGTTQDLGLIKGLTGFHINESQHLIATYDNGTTEDLGAIFQGNVNINGNFTANSIIETMSGYTFESINTENLTKENVYAGVVKNGNKLTLVYAFNITRTDTIGGTVVVGKFNVPSAIISKLYQTQIGTYNCLAFGKMVAIKSGNIFADQYYLITKNDNYNQIIFQIQGALINNLVLNEKYYIRMEITLLLSNNLS